MVLLHDHRFIVAVAALLAFLVSAQVPQLAGQQTNIMVLVLILAGLLIGGYSADSAIAATKAGPVNQADAIRQIVESVLGDFVSTTGAVSSTSTVSGAVSVTAVKNLTPPPDNKG